MYNKAKLKNYESRMFNDFDEDFVNIDFKPHVEKKLLGYQMLHVMTLISIYKKNNDGCAVDFSCTGTGKTYTAIALCSQMNLNPIIICPKNVICYWKEICEYYNVLPRTIINYESMKKGKDLDDNMTKKKSDVIDVDKDNFSWKNIDKKKNIIIFDEAHRCKNHKSLNGKLLLSAKGVCKILLLSATIAQKYEDFQIFGYMLNFYKQIKYGTKWIKSLLREETFRLSKKDESRLVEYIYPNKGSRMSYSDMSKYISKNHITTQCYTLDEKSTLLLKKEYKLLKENINHPLTEQLRSRQKIEELKLPIFVDLSQKYLEEGNSIVIFINFLKSLEFLCQQYTNLHLDHSVIFGDQTIEERQANIDLFQTNSNRIIICMIQAGSESISLHDKDGNNPRISLISPSFSGKELLQALGRIYRTGVKSRVEQKIIFCDEPTEKVICEKIKEKINFMNNFADFDKLNPEDFDIKIK